MKMDLLKNIKFASKGIWKRDIKKLCGIDWASTLENESGTKGRK